MSTSQHTISEEKRAEIRRSWPQLDAELPDMIKRMDRLREAAEEQSLCGQLRQAVHRSGLTLNEVAERIGLHPDVLSDWLQGIHNLRSDVMDRIAQAVGAHVSVTVGERSTESADAKVN